MKKKHCPVIEITLRRKNKNNPSLEITAKSGCEDRETVAQMNKW